MVDENELSNARLQGAAEVSARGKDRPASAFQAAGLACGFDDASVVLITRRLTLRAPAARDLPSLVRLANNPAVARNLGRMPHPYTADNALHWITEASRAGPKLRTLAITGRYDDSFLGGCGYRPVEGNPDHVTLGYWLGEPHWGQGIAAEAAQAVIDLAFEIEDISCIEVSVRSSNHQSKRVIEKCGFQFTRHGMAKLAALSGTVSVDCYMMARRTWESLHAWGMR